jgi:hypothetical protein
VSLRDAAQQALEALREALNAPQPEPVATPRREWEPLSLCHISLAWHKAYPSQLLSQAALNFARDLEAALKERNT